MFQSLFYWKNHFNYTGKPQTGTGMIVSILVLLEEPLQQHFLTLSNNDNTFEQFLQPLKLKFFTPNRPLLTIFQVISAHFFFLKLFYNEHYEIRYFLTPEICLKKNGVRQANIARRIVPPLNYSHWHVKEPRATTGCSRLISIIYKNKIQINRHPHFFIFTAIPRCPHL